MDIFLNQDTSKSNEEMYIINTIENKLTYWYALRKIIWVSYAGYGIIHLLQLKIIMPRVEINFSLYIVGLEVENLNTDMLIYFFKQ